MHVYEIGKKDVVSRLEKEIIYRKRIEDELRNKKKVLVQILYAVDKVL